MIRYTLATRLARHLRALGRPLPPRALGEALRLQGPVEPVLLPLLDGRFWHREEVGLWEWVYPFPPEKVVVLDLETTGLAPSEAEIIEVGLVVLEGGKKRTLSRLVRPHRPPSPFITRLTGLSWEDLREAPPLEEVIPEVHEALQGGTLVLHNASFDLSFLGPALRRVGLSWEGPVVDTVVLARRALPGVRRVGLDSLAEVFDLRPKERHRALGDALLTLEVLHEVYYMLTAGRPRPLSALGRGVQQI
ncbi:3'-5' exonuclease [Thermus filiformis]|uniref:DNA polymerase III subunit epsilon n=1 Tax=Thermus filiformis TaxID=276 RepID=A0A0A2WXE4_THEFI|nr:3'-5' exonuclease [Thermus filiformis]KGQ22970.1 DNA polymerase III subunit epsilon [Thermus filiformis]